MNVICLNCGNTYEGNFCPLCGQKAATKRLRLKEMAGNFVNSFVGGDNVFLRTCCDLIIRPGYMVRDYLLGKRIKYYNPLQMFVFTLTAYAIVSYILGINSSILDDMTSIDLKLDDHQLNMEMTAFIVSNYNKLMSNKLYGTLFGIVSAILPYRFVFCKCKIERPDGMLLSLNNSEQFYAQMFHACVKMLASIALLPICLIKGSDNVVTILYSITTIIYLVVLYRQLMGIGWVKSVVLNFLSILLSFVLLFVLMGLVGVVASVADSTF